MSKPLLRAEAIIVSKDGKAVLVQCDKEEFFYRFPGGTIEFGETAAEAIRRELMEEYDLQLEIGPLACLNESVVEYDGKKRHDCTILHWGKIDESLVPIAVTHKERAEVMLTWRSYDRL